MDYRAFMAQDAWDLFWTYVELMPGEVGCLGYVTVDHPNKDIVIDEIFLVPQESDTSQVDFVTTGLPFAIEKAIADDRVNDLRYCIHSHGPHGAMWSSTDEDMIKKIGGSGTPWFLSTIFNRKGESTTRLDIFDLGEFGRSQVTFKDIPLAPDRAGEYIEKCIADLEKFVSKPKPSPKPKSGAHSTYVPGQGWVLKSETDRDAKSASTRLVTEASAGKETAEIALIDPELVHARAIELLGPDDVLDVHDLAELYGWGWADSDGLRYYYNAAGCLVLDATEMVVVNSSVVDEDPLTAEEIAEFEDDAETERLMAQAGLL